MTAVQLPLARARTGEQNVAQGSFRTRRDRLGSFGRVGRRHRVGLPLREGGTFVWYPSVSARLQDAEAARIGRPLLGSRREAPITESCGQTKPSRAAPGDRRASTRHPAAVPVRGNPVVAHRWSRRRASWVAAYAIANLAQWPLLIELQSIVLEPDGRGSHRQPRSCALNAEEVEERAPSLPRANRRTLLQ
jgi:hypothetical protein